MAFTMKSAGLKAGVVPTKASRTALVVRAGKYDAELIETAVRRDTEQQLNSTGYQHGRGQQGGSAKTQCKIRSPLLRPVQPLVGRLPVTMALHSIS